MKLLAVPVRYLGADVITSCVGVMLKVLAVFSVYVLSQRADRCWTASIWGGRNHAAPEERM